MQIISCLPHLIHFVVAFQSTSAFKNIMTVCAGPPVCLVFTWHLCASSCVNYPAPSASPVSPLSTQGLHFLPSSLLNAFARATHARPAFMYHSSTRWFHGGLPLTLLSRVNSVLWNAASSSGEYQGAASAAMPDNQPQVCFQCHRSVVLWRKCELTSLLSMSCPTGVRGRRECVFIFSVGLWS